MLRKSLRFIKDFLVKYLPSPALKALGIIYGMFIWRRSYSQYGEDLVVVNYFDSLGIKHGAYLDIGGFHPTWISNTKLLHDAGWHGYVVDIDRVKCRVFEIVRGTQCTTYHGAVGPENDLNGKHVEVYRFKRLLSEIDTLSRKDAEVYSREWGVSFTTDSVEYISVQELLAKTGPVDFLNIDIEGLDSVVLQSIDFTTFAPKVICFEDNRAWGGGEETRKLLESHGYERLFVCGGSVGYCLPGGSIFESNR